MRQASGRSSPRSISVVSVQATAVGTHGVRAGGTANSTAHRGTALRRVLQQESISAEFQVARSFQAPGVCKRAVFGPTKPPAPDSPALPHTRASPQASPVRRRPSPPPPCTPRRLRGSRRYSLFAFASLFRLFLACAVAGTFMTPQLPRSAGSRRGEERRPDEKRSTKRRAA